MRLSEKNVMSEDSKLTREQGSSANVVKMAHSGRKQGIRTCGKVQERYKKTK